MDKNIKLDLLQDETSALTSQVVRTVPVVGGIANSILEGVAMIRRNEQLKRLERFLNAAEVDHEYVDYINELKEEDEARTLFLEYIESVISTPNPLVCVALALIFRDDNIGESLKSLCARSLNGLSQGCLNFFFKIMEHVSYDETSFKDAINERGLPVSPEQVGVKDSIERSAFSNELISRSICSTGTTISDVSDSLAMSTYSFLLYKKLQDAQRYLEEL